MKKKKKHYKSIFTTNKSFSFIAILIFFLFTNLSLFIICMQNQDYFKSVFFILCFGVSSSFLINNKIVLENYFIRIYFGIFIYKIKYKDIKCLYKINNHLIGLASSKKRVGIKIRNFKFSIFDIFVSPIDRDDFIYEVSKYLK